MAPAFEKLIRTLVGQFITEVDNWVADNMKKYRPEKADKRIDTGITIYQYIRSDEVPPPLYVILPPGP